MNSKNTNLTSTEKEPKASEAALPKNFIQKLKIKWGLHSIFQVILILVVFSITGTTVVFLRKTLFSWIGFDETTDTWIKTVTYILFVFPAYQALLLFYGSLVGQFEFFWNKEKKMLSAVKRMFSKK